MPLHSPEIRQAKIVIAALLANKIPTCTYNGPREIRPHLFA